MMSSNIVSFPRNKNKANEPVRSCTSSGRPYRLRGDGKNRFTLLFRSRETILDADETALISDVCFDIDRAHTKLKGIRKRLESLQEYATNEIQMLTEAETKLSAALVAALLSKKGKS